MTKEGAKPSSMGRLLPLALAIVVVLVVGALVLARVIFPETSPAPTGPGATGPTAALPKGAGAAVAVPATIAGVIEVVSGVAERRAPGGSWQALRGGDVVNEDDAIRTVDNSEVTLKLGDSVTVDIASSTDVRVGQISRTLSRIRLDDGRVASVVRGGAGFKFRVEVRDSQAVAETGSGDFAVLRGPKGAVAVAASKGKVKLSAADKDVTVGEGQQAIVTPGGSPSQPTDLPAALLLELGPPPPATTMDNTVTVTGRTNPGVILNIHGRAVVPAGDGSFQHEVVVTEGENIIKVSVLDVVGRKKSAVLPKITVTPRVRTAPSTEVVW